VPDGFQVVHYRSAGRDLMAWFAAPAPAAGAPRRPALLFSHGGYALGVGDDLPARRFLEAGFVVMVPAYRGENGNPGDHEMMLGEVDDAVEAVRWLAARPDVDPARIYAFGHSAGGLIASMLALVPDLPLAATGSIDALYDEAVFTSQAEVIPFDPSDATEVKYRLLLPNIAALVRPHRAYLASDGYPVTLRARADAEARQAGVALTTHVVPGDHMTCVEPATEAFFEHVRGLEVARK
jgi:acetyl esterase/lipase